MIEHDLYRRLLDQAHAVATYHQDLIANDLAPSDDDRDALERAADHVAALAGYKGVECSYVADTLWRGLRDKTKPREEATTTTRHHALCVTCGYVGRSFENRADAVNDGDEHEIAVGNNQQHHYTRVVSEMP